MVNLKERENYIVIILLIYKSSQTSVLSISPITSILFLLYLAYIFLKRNIKIGNFFVYFTILYYVILIIYFIQFGWIDFFLSVYIYIKFLIGYLAIKILNVHFFKYFVRVVYIGSLIVIPFYILQILFLEETFYLLGVLQNNISFLEFKNDNFANLFLFSIKNVSGSELRNSGFMWEPKGFANILILALIFNFITKKKQVFNKQNILFFLMLLTTFSTTGYICFIFLCIIILITRSNFKSILFTFFVSLLIIPFILSQDFMVNKIKYELSLTEDYKKKLYDKTFEVDQISLGRISSFIVDYNDFLKKPIIGFGYQRSERTQNPYVKLTRVNGFSDILATYGLLGIFFMIISYYLLFHKLLSFYDFDNKILITSFFVLIILTIYFASAVTSHILWMSFLFLHLNFTYDK